MKLSGSRPGLSTRGRRTAKITAPPPPPTPSVEPHPPTRSQIVEEESYHLLVDGALERRFREIHDAVAMMRPRVSQAAVSQADVMEPAGSEAGAAAPLDRGTATCPACAASRSGPAPRR